MNNPAYAKQASSTPAKSGGGTLLGIFIGLVLGILIALGVVLFLNKAALPFQDKYEGASKPSAANGNGQTATPLALPGKPGGTVPEKQHLDFYGILEGKTATTNPPANQAQTSTPSGTAVAERELLNVGDSLVWVEAGSRDVNGVRTGTHGTTSLTPDDAEAIRREIRSRRCATNRRAEKLLRLDSPPGDRRWSLGEIEIHFQN